MSDQPRKLHITPEAVTNFIRNEEEANALGTHLALAALGLPAPRPASYTCPRCDLESFHPEDVKHKYCGACNRFESVPG